MNFEQIEKQYPVATKKLLDFCKSIYREMFGRDLEFINQVSNEEDAIKGIAKGIWERGDRVLYDFFDQNKIFITVDYTDGGQGFWYPIVGGTEMYNISGNNRIEVERTGFLEAVKLLEESN